jgi:Na+/H+-dicarboxylate symporter
MIIVLDAVGLPWEGIGLILAVDRVLDMLRTSVNVWGDCVGTAVIAHREGEKLYGQAGDASSTPSGGSIAPPSS